MTSRQRPIGILLFLAVFAFAYFVVWGEITQAYAGYQNMEIARQEAADLAWLIANQSGLSRDFSMYKSANSALFDFAPDTFVESDPLMALYVATKNSGGELMRVDSKKPELTGSVSIQVGLRGKLATLQEFLKLLERSYPFFDFVGTRVSDANAAEEFVIDLRMYTIAHGEKAPISSYQELRKEIEAALKTQADILKDDRLLQFKSVTPLPVTLPTPDAVGGRDPFASL